MSHCHQPGTKNKNNFFILVMLLLFLLLVLLMLESLSSTVGHKIKIIFRKLMMLLLLLILLLLLLLMLQLFQGQIYHGCINHDISVGLSAQSCLWGYPTTSKDFVVVKKAVAFQSNRSNRKYWDIYFFQHKKYRILLQWYLVERMSGVRSDRLRDMFLMIDYRIID